jgi:uncharacterized protein YuzE
MHVRYDAEADAACIQLAERVEPGQASRQLHSIATPGGRGEIVLDFDAAGVLLGVEVLNAEAALPASLLRDAVRIGRS